MYRKDAERELIMSAGGIPEADKQITPGWERMRNEKLRIKNYE